MTWHRSGPPRVSPEHMMSVLDDVSSKVTHCEPYTKTMESLNRSHPLDFSVLGAFTWSNHSFTCSYSLGSLQNERWLEREVN